MLARDDRSCRVDHHEDHDKEGAVMDEDTVADLIEAAPVDPDTGLRNDAAVDHLWAVLHERARRLGRLTGSPKKATKERRP